MLHELSEVPAWSLYLYISFSRKLSRAENFCKFDEGINVLKKTFKNISNEDIELFLLYEIDLAMDYVNNLLEQPSISSRKENNTSFSVSPRPDGSPDRRSNMNNRQSINRETKNFALKIINCHLYK